MAAYKRRFKTITYRERYDGTIHPVEWLDVTGVGNATFGMRLLFGEYHITHIPTGRAAFIPIFERSEALRVLAYLIDHTQQFESCYDFEQMAIPIDCRDRFYRLAHDLLQLVSWPA